MAQNPKSISFTQVIAELLDNNKPFSPVHLHRFSDISPSDLTELEKSWPDVDPKRRAAVLEDLEELAESDTLVCFDDLSLMCLKDENPSVRVIAIRLLWETNDTSVSDRLIQMLKNDPDETVRAAAASGLGIYIYLGELDEIPKGRLRRTEEALLQAYSGSDNHLVKRKCLESLGFSSRKEIPSMIQESYEKENIEWRASAVYAMSRSAEKRWEKHILESLNDPDAEIRFEAIRAAGELELQNARLPILEMLTEPENREDEDIFQAIVWSLSQIGGENIREVLSALLEQADDEEADLITNALENLGLTEGLNMFDLIDIELDDENAEDDLAELELDDEDEPF